MAHHDSIEASRRGEIRKQRPLPLVAARIESSAVDGADASRDQRERSVVGKQNGSLGPRINRETGGAPRRVSARQARVPAPQCGSEASGAKALLSGVEVRATIL